MARPLPEDLEKTIAGTAKRAEIRSVAIFAFILGGIIGFGFAAALFAAETEGAFAFFAAVAVFAVYWWLSRRSRP